MDYETGKNFENIHELLNAHEERIKALENKPSTDDKQIIGRK